MILLDLNDITLSYPRAYFGQPKIIFKDFSLTLAPTEIVGLIGTNGSGKTTLIKAIGGLIPIDSGTIKRHNKICAYVPDHYEGAGFLTPRQFLAMACQLHKMPKDEQTNKIDHHIQRMHLELYQNQPISTLSRGTKQRLVIAHALILAPNILLLDEPFSGLDEISTTIITSTLKEFARSGGGVLCTGHTPNNALYTRMVGL